MKSESPTNKKHEWRFYLYFAIMLLFGGKFLLENRCDFIACEPASWPEIQEIVIDHINKWDNEYGLSDFAILITKTNIKGLEIDEFLEDIEIFVFYISADETYNQESYIYSTRSIGFDDKNLWVTSSRGSTNSLPSGEFLRKFKQVQIGYREAIKITWDDAHKTATIIPIELVFIKLFLGDRFNEGFGDIPIWKIEYENENETIWYWIDVKNGNIIKSGKN